MGKKQNRCSCGLCETSKIIYERKMMDSFSCYSCGTKWRWDYNKNKWIKEEKGGAL